MVAGLEEISDGTIAIGDKIVNGLEPAERDIAMVFQDYALYPHMTVRENMSFGLKLRKFPRKEIETRIQEALAERLRGCTMLVVAQRISTVLKADKIVVLDNGNVVGIGKHRDLLDTCPVYKEIVYSQLSEEDLSK